jgi:tetrahydromethanopterin S-methyltransferase subunit G
MPSYRDIRYPFVGFLKGLVVGLIPSLLIVLLTMRKQPLRRRR